MPQLVRLAMRNDDELLLARAKRGKTIHEVVERILRHAMHAVRLCERRPQDHALHVSLEPGELGIEQYVVHGQQVHAARREARGSRVCARKKTM